MELGVRRIQGSTREGVAGVDGTDERSDTGVRAHSGTGLRWPWSDVLSSYGTYAAR